MKKLRKQDRDALEVVCTMVKERLHIEHWRCYYSFEKASCDDTETQKSAAQCRLYPDNNRICICFFDGFWEYNAEEQLHCLIHEHVHAVLQPYSQLVGVLLKDLSTDGKWLTGKWERQTSEHVTDHLEAVLYDLLKDKL